MKKIVASVGLVAVGATGLQAAYAPGLSRMETSKPWSISASLRGFYDDNYTTLPSKAPAGYPTKKGSFGLEFSPSVTYNLPLESTFIGLRYTYSLQYFEDRTDNNVDHQHEFLAKVDHKFSERFTVRLDESFVYSQEPEVIDPDLAFPLRTDSDVLRNRAKARLRASVTEVLGVDLAYENTFYDYTDSGVGSRSSLLDRMQHLVTVDGRYLLQPKTVGLLGYQFGINNYTGDEAISYDSLLNPIYSKIRDSRSHYFYLGAEQELTRQFTGTLKVGAQYTDFHRVNQSAWNPYVEGSGTYEYLPGSFVQFGLKHTRLPTDVVGVGSDSVTLDQEATILFGSVTHRITPQLTGGLSGQFQNASFNGGLADGDTDNLFLIGVNLDYTINQYWSAEVGYNFDRLDSDQPLRSFSRNRVYIGVRAKM